MTFFRTIRTAAVAATLLSTPLMAQEQASQFKMPEECAAVPAQADMAGGMAGHPMPGGPTASRDMAGMGNPGEGMPAGNMGNAPTDGQVPPGPGGMPAMGGMGMMGMANMKDMPEHMRENMRRMAVTMPAMMQGMMGENPDTAFACGMIAHHQSAIDMAQVLLENGEDPTMRALAESIITSQTAEIADMRAWLTENAKK